MLAVKIHHDECLRLLSGASFGRVAMSVRSLPRIVPVTFDLHRGRLHCRAHGTLELGAALDKAVVALQVDGYGDGNTRGVWNVHVVGRVTDRHDRCFVMAPGIVDGEWLRF